MRPRHNRYSDVRDGAGAGHSDGLRATARIEMCNPDNIPYKKESLRRASMRLYKFLRHDAKHIDAAGTADMEEVLEVASISEDYFNWARLVPTDARHHGQEDRARTGRPHCGDRHGPRRDAGLSRPQA